jgi:hypothetical protein
MSEDFFALVLMNLHTVFPLKQIDENADMPRSGLIKRLDGPSRVVLGDRCAVTSQGAATIQLKWRLALLVIVLAIAGRHHVTGKCLNGGGRQNSGELSQMSTSSDPRQALANCVAKTFHKVQADELLVGIREAVAVAGVWHGVGCRNGIDNIQGGIYSDTQPEVMHRLTGGAGT